MTCYWAMLEHPDPTSKQPHRTLVEHSGNHGTEAALAGWIRTRRQEGSTVHAFRHDNGRDHRLFAEEEYPPQPERLKAILTRLRTLIDAKRYLDTTGRPQSTPAIPHAGSGTVNALAPMLTYDEAYSEEVF
jgi:hypothetical protein